jgi:YD repeat-containing protein
LRVRYGKNILFGQALWQCTATITAPALVASTVQRDALTTRFYDARGNLTGSATTYGNQTKFYEKDGKLIGSATTRGR